MFVSVYFTGSEVLPEIERLRKWIEEKRSLKVVRGWKRLDVSISVCCGTFKRFDDDGDEGRKV